jgi:hypothetical protein
MKRTVISLETKKQIIDAAEKGQKNKKTRQKNKKDKKIQRYYQQ